MSPTAMHLGYAYGPTIKITDKERIIAVNKRCGRSLVGIAGSNPPEGMDVCFLLVVCAVT